MAEMQNEQFKLPDGTLVGTGNNVNPAGPQLMARPFPTEFLLDPKDIEKLMKQRSLKKERETRGKRMPNQGQVGSCNLYMACSMKYQIDALNGFGVTPLAPEHAYARINGGRDVGSLLDIGMEHMMTKGCARHGLVPYETYNRSQQGDVRAADADALKRRVHEPYKLPDDFPTYCHAMASAIARGYPIGFAWHVGGESMRLDGRGYAVIANGPGNHATMLHSGVWVGGTQMIHPDALNSWGPCVDERFGRLSRRGWGDGGFGLFTMEQAFATRRYHDHYVMTSSLNTESDGPL